jgi:hypothetical protein
MLRHYFQTSFRFIFIQSLFFCTHALLHPAASGAQRELQQLVQDALKVNGQGVLTRIRNMTEYGADVKFEPILHDKIPKNTTGRIKRVDGSYLTCRKVDNTPTLAFEKCEATDKATLWTFDRIKDESLHDWLGLSHVNADGKYLEVNATNGRTQFGKIQFRVEDKAAQWEIAGTNLGSFSLRNRLTGGTLHFRTKEEDVAVGEDKENISIAQDLMYCEFGDIVVKENYNRTSGKTPLVLVDGLGQAINSPGGGNPVVNTAEGFPPSATFHPYSVHRHGDGTPNFWLHQDFNHRVRLNNRAFDARIQFHRDRNVRTGSGKKYDDSWEELIFEKRGEYGDGFIRYGENVVIKTRHNTTVRRSGGSYIHNNDPEDPNFSYFRLLPAALGDDMNAPTVPNKVSFSRVDPESWAPIKGFFDQIALANSKEAYGVSFRKKLYRWDGGSWQPVGTTFRPQHVSVSNKGELCCVDVENKMWIKSGVEWGLATGSYLRASIRSANEIWAITKDGGIVRYNGSSGEPFNLPSGKAIWISVSDGGSVWAISDDKNGIWRYNIAAKNWNLMPGQGKRIAVRSENDAWLVGTDHRLYHFENNNWVQRPPTIRDVAAASGVTKTTIKAARKKETTHTITTLDASNKPYMGEDPTRCALEIEQLGMGGAIGPKVSIDFGSIPAAQHPRITGFAVDRIEEFDPTSILSLNPLISQGAAWLETALAKPDKGGLSFMMRVRDKGDAQVVFGTEMSNSFAYKIIFGGWGNTKSAIVKREYVKGDPVDTVVYELTEEQSPIARIQSGGFLTYWVSIDDGFIMAGMGDFGANPFLAWRDPKPRTGITRIGFGSHRAPVYYSNIKYTPPAIFSRVPRVFATSKTPYKPTGEVAWSDFPFRMNDRGSLQTRIAGTKGGAIILARKNNITAPHYAIVFGDDDNKAISIKKWHTSQKRYNERARIKLDPLPELKLSTKPKTYWVSFYFGQIVIGTGNIGENPLYIFQDPAPINNIDSIGFNVIDKGDAAFSNIRIGAPLALRAEEQAVSYDKTGGASFFSGGLTTILPFDYELSQQDQVVKLTDYVLDASYYLAATPQQGAIYPMQATINPNGTISIEWTKAPENQKQIDVQRVALKIKNDAELEKIEAERLRAIGALDKASKVAAGDKQRGLASSLSQGGQALATAGSTLAGAGAAAGPLGLIVAAAGIGIVAGGVGMIAASTAISAKAADKDFEGAEAEIVKKRQAAELDANAARKKQVADAGATEATVGLRALDSYVFVDKPGVRPDMSSVATSTTAQANQAAAKVKLEEAATIRPTRLEDMIKLSLLFQDFVLLANQSSVLSGDSAFKTRFLNGVDKLLVAYNDAFTKDPSFGTPLHQDMLTLLLQAYNNPYLINEFIPDEAKMKESWYWFVTRFGRHLITTNPNQVIATNKFYGEYIWLDNEAGFGFTTPSSGMIAFEALGTDIFVCLAEEKARVRNKEIEVYEINIGGWDNTKTAIRIKSLDRYVAVIEKKDNPKAMGDPTSFKKYWISCKAGLISIGCGTPGKNTVLTWLDPYPNLNITTIGLSSWNSRVEYRNITILDADAIEIEEAAPTDSASDFSGLDIETRIKYLEALNKDFEADAVAAKAKAKRKEYKKSDILTPEAAASLEEIGTNLCKSGFDERASYNSDQLTRFRDIVNLFSQDVADDGNYSTITAIADTITSELAAKPATKKVTATAA